MSAFRRRAGVGALLLGCGLVSCAAPGDEAANGPPEDSTREVTWAFTDVTDAAGIDFAHVNDPSANRFLPETMGSGAAFADFDGDALPDVYFVNGAPLSSGERGPGGRLYRNAGGGRFEDVSGPSGLDGSFYGMGAAVADVDRDGALDLLVTAVGQDRLFRNTGDLRFEDVTTGSGLDRSEGAFSTSAAFLDFDRDGDLDVFVCRYVAWSADTDLECRPDGVHRAYCTPERYPAIGNQLWRNDTTPRGIAFTDVSVEAGIAAVEGKALGVAVFDHDGDGWPDVIVANDTVRNFLFRNRADGTFDEIGVEAGVAYSESGAARGGMGIDTGDVDGDGRSDVVIGNFAYEMSALFRCRTPGVYVDDAPQFGLGLATLSTLAFGVKVVDLNLDGWDDVVIVNGHIEPDIADMFPGQAYAQPVHVLRNVDGERLVEMARGDLTRPLVGRGLAVADYDADGDSDLLVTQNGRGARLFRNDAATDASWLQVRLTGAGGNATPFGTRVDVFAAARPAPAATRLLRSGGSYLSAGDPVLTVGLGSTDRVDSLVVVWGGGRRTVVRDPRIRTRIDVREP